jgi:hypothetical protein
VVVVVVVVVDHKSSRWSAGCVVTREFLRWPCVLLSQLAAC